MVILRPVFLQLWLQYFLLFWSSFRALSWLQFGAWKRVGFLRGRLVVFFCCCFGWPCRCSLGRCFGFCFCVVGCLAPGLDPCMVVSVPVSYGFGCFFCIWWNIDDCQTILTFQHVISSLRVYARTRCAAAMWRIQTAWASAHRLGLQCRILGDFMGSAARRPAGLTAPQEVHRNSLSERLQVTSGLASQSGLTSHHPHTRGQLFQAVQRLCILSLLVLASTGIFPMQTLTSISWPRLWLLPSRSDLCTEGVFGFGKTCAAAAVL